MRPQPALARLLILAIVLSLLPSMRVQIAIGQDGEESADAEPEEGLRFRLSEGSEKIEPPKPNVVSQASALSETDTQNLLARLPSIKPEPSDVQGFKLREGSVPPPRAGATIRAAFSSPAPDAPQPPSKTTSPLEVLRFAPEGEVPLAPALSVTFSQPMIAIASQEEAGADVPVTLTPQPKGKWRWLGTQTLTFQPDMEGARLPMATNYTVNIPAGTRSALGNPLPGARTFNFATPPPTIKSSYPSGTSQEPDALIFLEFDQRIDAARVLEGVRLQPAVSGISLRLVTPEEIAANSSIKGLVKGSQDGRWIAFRAVASNGSTKNALPSDTDIKVIIPRGTPSAEGPRVTLNEQSITFRTYGALRVTDSQCGYEKRCAPFDPMYITFSNHLDMEDIPSSKVTITPPIPDAQFMASGDSLKIEGVKRSNTTYTVTLDRSLKDRFGQTLTGNNQLTFKVTTADPRLFGTDEAFIVLDQVVRGTFSVYSVNYRQLKVRLYKVTPEDWGDFRSYQFAFRSQRETPAPPGTLVFEKVIGLTSKPDELSETAIDLSPALTHGFGQVFVLVEPVEDKNVPARVYSYTRDRGVIAWVQATDIGLDAFVDKRGFVAWANSLKDGSPLAGVEMTLLPDDLAGRTEADGLVRLAFNAAPDTSGLRAALLVARRGDDVAILPQSYHSVYYSQNESSSWRRANSGEALSWYVFDDRKLYRPGEEVNIKGWIRKVDLTPTGDTELFAAAGETINYILKDSQGNEITKGSAKLNALAGFNLMLQLPGTMNLGGSIVEFKLEEDGGTYSHHFQVQEFRRPEFEIAVQASEAPHFIGSSATASMTATYYTGGALANTEVNWTVISSPTNYTPPNRGDYTFGKFYSWWLGESEDGESKTKTFTGKTGAEGRHALRMDFDGVTPPRASSVTAEARVQDVNRQTLAAATTLLVHPADVYVGLKSARTFVQKG
ncbi:MAG: Ig-like domain-containing protein, partial [Acidobacteria bacterium]|nr:Ig-like domain-containing protein [Acidobacteriota bacterium]